MGNILDYSCLENKNFVKNLYAGDVVTRNTPYSKPPPSQFFVKVVVAPTIHQFSRQDHTRIAGWNEDIPVWSLVVGM